MTDYTLTFVLTREATFARGDGVAGLLDREVAHDEFGLPYLHGRTLKGLLSEEADNLLFALGPRADDPAPWRAARHALFGRPGSHADGQGMLHVGHARLPAALRQTVQLSLGRDGGPGRVGAPGRADVLGALTAVRRQTAVDPTGLPRDNSLRAMRVVIRRTPFAADLTTLRPLSPPEEMLLAAAVLAFRRAGSGRNRGRGQLTADLLRDGRSILLPRFQEFTREALS